MLGWAAGAHPHSYENSGEAELAVTHDGGQTWALAAAPAETGAFYGVSFIDAADLGVGGGKISAGWSERADGAVEGGRGAGLDDAAAGIGPEDSADGLA